MCTYYGIAAARTGLGWLGYHDMMNLEWYTAPNSNLANVPAAGKTFLGFAYWTAEFVMCVGCCSSRIFMYKKKPWLSYLAASLNWFYKAIVPWCFNCSWCIIAWLLVWLVDSFWHVMTEFGYAGLFLQGGVMLAAAVLCMLRWFDAEPFGCLTAMMV